MRSLATILYHSVDDCTGTWICNGNHTIIVYLSYDKDRSSISKLGSIYNDA